MPEYLLMLDAGHGGKDPGAVSQYGREEDYSLMITKYQYERFKALGIKVGLTRDSDETLTENQRVALAQKGTYCISNHLNAGGGDRAEVIHSIYDDGKLAQKIKAQLIAAGQNNVKTYFRKGSDGRDYYYMHRRTGKTITNIVEYCFIDNKADFEHFKANWKDYAEAVVRAFCSHVGHVYKAPIQKEAPKVSDNNKPSTFAKTAWEKSQKKIGKDGNSILDGTRPQEPLTREQFAVVLDRLGLLD